MSKSNPARASAQDWPVSAREAREPCGRLQRLLCLPYAEIGLGELEQRQWIPGTSRLCSLKVDECAPVLFFLKV